LPLVTCTAAVRDGLPAAQPRANVLSFLPPAIEVHGTTLLMGVPVPREQTPANVQVATGRALTSV